MQKIGYDERRKHLSKLLISVKPSRVSFCVYWMPAITVHAQTQPSFTWRNPSASHTFIQTGCADIMRLGRNTTLFDWTLHCHSKTWTSWYSYKKWGSLLRIWHLTAWNTYISSAHRDVLHHLPVQGIIRQLWRFYSFQSGTLFFSNFFFFSPPGFAIHLLYRNFGMSYRKKS